MDDLFRNHVESLVPKLEALRAQAGIPLGDLPHSIPQRGVYLFSEAGRDLYVGRSNSIRQRLKNHCLPGSPHGKAAFAFRLARESTGQLKASYTADGSRAALLLDPTFAQAFVDAKARLRRMTVRYVEENDPIRQTLLEVYVAVVLRTPYNDFDNH